MKRLIWLLLLIPCVLRAQTATPCTFSPAPGSYSATQTVTLSSTGAMFYTTDGTTPTLASTHYTGPLTVTATQTIKCISAIVGASQANAQNNNPSSGGTFWKNANCGSFGAWSGTATYATGAKVSYSGFNYIATAASTAAPPTTNPSKWSKYSSCSADDPGGNGISTVNPTHTSGNTTPSLSGASMLFAQTAQPSEQTNVLWTITGGFANCPGCTYFLEDHYYYWNSSNSSSNEDDSFNFDTTSSIRYMKGMQYCYGSGCPGGATGWDYGGNSNVPWTNMGVTAGGTLFTWHHVQTVFHRVVAEETSKPCSASGSWPYIYFDILTIDGAVFGPWKFCANALPPGWSSVTGQQAQIDIGPHSTAVASQVYWDYINFMALYNPGTAVSGTYTITSGFTAPMQLRGTIVTSGKGMQLQ